MAEGLFRALDGEQRTGLQADSAGLFTTEGIPASDFAIQAAQERGADLSAHRSRMLSAALLEQAQYIFCMTQSHYDSLLQAFPQAEKKAYLLADTDISDPFGGSLEIYRATCAQIEQAVKQIIERLETLHAH
jgi:protein-tyrosine-phosphatase